jgi:drug/metabolite transporter (DMT)-like permease
MAQIIFSTIIQWLVYGNHPSMVAFVGMAVISAAGLCSVVSHRRGPVAMLTI